MLGASRPADGASPNTAVSSSPTERDKPAVELEPVRWLAAELQTTSPVAQSDEATLLATWNLGGTRDPEHPTNSAKFHAASRVVVETKVLSRIPQRSNKELSRERILARARSQGYWPFRLCYEAGLRRQALEGGPTETPTVNATESVARRLQREQEARKKRSIKGKTLLRFSISPRGGVSYARRLSSELPAPVADCLRQATYALGFDPPPKRRIDVDLSIQLSPGDTPPPTDEDLGPTAGANGLEAVDRALLGLEAPISACYRTGLERDSKLWGRVELYVKHDPQRGTIEVDSRSSTFPDPTVTACVRERVIKSASLSRAVRSLRTAHANLPKESAETSPCDLVIAWRFGHLPPRLGNGL